MPEYPIAFNDEWVPHHTVEEVREKAEAVRPLIAEMKAAGVRVLRYVSILAERASGPSSHTDRPSDFRP